MKSLRKKGQLEQFGGLVQSLGFIAILLAVVFLIVATVKTQIVEVDGNDTAAYNATSEVQNAMGSIPGWLPIVVVAVIGAVLLGLIQFFRRA